MFIRVYPRLVLVLLVCLGGTGCAYGKARARDFSQVLRLDLGVALGMDVDTRLGGLMDFGLGGGYSWDLALLYGEPYAGKQLRIVAPGFCRRALGPTRIWSHECPTLLPPVFAEEHYELPDYTHLGTHLHEFDVEVEVTAIFVHVRFGLSPGELADAFLGIFGVDIAGDDTGTKPAPFIPKPPKPAPAAERPGAAPPGPRPSPSPPPAAAPPAGGPAGDRDPIDLSAPPKTPPPR